jgi:hypothetical protein
MSFLRHIGLTNRFFPRWDAARARSSATFPAIATPLLHNAILSSWPVAGKASLSRHNRTKLPREAPPPQKPRLTREAANRLRERENLLLSLRRVLQQLENCHNPHHRAMLEQARADLERKIRELGG